MTLKWTDEQGRSGLNHSLGLTAILLDSGGDESGGLLVGDLIINLLRKAGDEILPVLPNLLEAMIKRMTTAKTPTFIQVSNKLERMFRIIYESQSLIIPVALLLRMHRDSTLDFLETAVISTADSLYESRSGLDVLLQTWCDNAEIIQGAWASRIRYSIF